MTKVNIIMAIKAQSSCNSFPFIVILLLGDRCCSKILFCKYTTKLLRLSTSGCLRGAPAPLYLILPLSFKGEGDKGGEDAIELIATTTL